jgi:hypothetical protein
VSLELRKALRKAIILSPRSFELRVEDVNPLLRFWTSGCDSEDEESMLGCFAHCRENVDGKIHQLTDGDGRKPESKGKRENGKPPDNGPDEPKGDKPTSRQIRYYGHLCYELGQTPDYEMLKGKNAQQASILIRELEEKRKKTKKN